MRASQSTRCVQREVGRLTEKARTRANAGKLSISIAREGRRHVREAELGNGGGGHGTAGR